MEALIAEVRNKQKESQEQYLQLDTLIEEAATRISQRSKKKLVIQQHNHESIMMGLQQMEENISKQLDSLVRKREALFEQIEKTLHLALKYSTAAPN